MDSRAAAVGSGGISSDDPDASTKLKEQLDARKLQQEHMSLMNSLARKGDREGLAKQGLSEETINKVLTPDWGGKCRAYEPYQLQNNNANIHRIEERIEQLAKASTRETKETETEAGIRMVENAEANRLQLFFHGKPDSDTRTKLKQHGFRWAPSEGAWQRHLNNGAIYAAQQFLTATA
jgi:hypothetical protein